MVSLFQHSFAFLFPCLFSTGHAHFFVNDNPWATSKTRTKAKANTFPLAQYLAEQQIQEIYPRNYPGNYFGNYPANNFGNYPANYFGNYYGQDFWPNTDKVPRFAVNFEDDPPTQNWAAEIMKPQKSPLVPENFPYEERISADHHYQPKISANQYQPQISADQNQLQISADQI